MRWLLLLLLALPLPALAADPPPPGRWAFDVGFLAGGAHGVDRPNLDLVLAGRGDQQLTPDGAPARVSLQVRGRVRFDLVPDPTPHAGRLDRLGLTVQRGVVEVRLGRHGVGGEGWRLLDGVQVTAATPARGLRVGGWVGLLPDPWSTLPSADRLGGGPIVSFRHKRVELLFLGEVAGVLAGPAGASAPATPALDRAALLLRGVVRPTDAVRVRGWLDLQGRSGGPVALADAGVHGAWRFARAWDLDGGWSVFSSLALLASHQRDEALSTFAARREAALGIALLPAEALDSTHYHAVTLRLRRRPGTLGPGDHLGGELRGRYRHAAVAKSRWLRVGPRVGAYGLADRRLDLEGDVAFLWTGGGPRLSGGPRLMATPDPTRKVSLEAAVLGIADLSGAQDPQHALAAEVHGGLWLGDVRVALGYELLAARDAAPSTTIVQHQGFLRVGIRPR